MLKTDVVLYKRRVSMRRMLLLVSGVRPSGGSALRMNSRFMNGLLDDNALFTLMTMSQILLDSASPLVRPSPCCYMPSFLCNSWVNNHER